MEHITTNPAATDAAINPAAAAADAAPAPETPMYALPCDSGDVLDTDDDNDERLWAMFDHPSVWDD